MVAPSSRRTGSTTRASRGWRSRASSVARRVRRAVSVARRLRRTATAGGPQRPARTVAVVLLTVLLVTAAGCTALGIEDPTADGTTTEQPTDAPTTAGTTAGTTNADGASGATTVGSTGTASTTSGDRDDGGHDHAGQADDEGGSGAATTTVGSGNGTVTPSPAGNATDPDARAGRLTVVVGAEEVTAGAVVETPGFRYDADDHHTWRAGNGTTLADALSTLGVEVGDGVLTYDGTTYRDGEDGVAVDVRVDGEPVDPAEYVLRDGDEVWVTVETPGMDRETPGEYVRAADQHVHGRMHVEVDGTVVDFSEARYQSGHRHFHFEGGHANPWHAHSFAVTLGYALGTLDGIAVGNGTFTYDGTTYRDADPGTTVSVTVDGEPVEPHSYYLKDGDDVHVVVETT